MAKFDSLREKIDALDKFSSDDRYTEAFADIQDAVQGSDNDDLEDLIEIVAEFRDKLPPDLSLNRVRADARDLDEDLSQNSIDVVIQGIGRRNDTLSRLVDALNKESEKAEQDADLLNKIREGVEKATKTIEEINDFVDQLSESDANAIDNIRALIDTLGNISSIFEPDEE